jgi:NitT/TauT family transport system permease protein
MNGSHSLKRARILPPLITLLILLSALECLVRTGVIREFIMPEPSQIIRTLWKERDSLGQALFSTFSSASLGFLGSVVIGISLAFLFSISDFLRRAVYPYAVFFQTVPIISIAPLLVIWFGFGQSTVVVSSFIVSVFPVIASTLLGLQSTDPQLTDLFKLYGASRRDHLFRLRLPSALPHIFSGFRIASGLAIVGAIVGEFIAGGGLGGVVDSARTQQRLDLVFAAVVMSSVLGLVFIGLINYLSWLMLWRWHSSERR